MNEPKQVIVKYICIADDAMMASNRCTPSEATELINLIRTTNEVMIEEASKGYDGAYDLDWIEFIPSTDPQYLDVVRIMLNPTDL